MRLQKIGIALAALSIVVSVVLWSIPAYDWEDGSPEMTLHFDIKKVGEIESISGSVDITDSTQLDNAMGTLTAFTATTDPLEPNGIYTITITPTITIQASSSQERDDFSVLFSATGHQVTDEGYYRYYYVGTTTYAVTNTVIVPHATPTAATIGTWDYTKLNVAGQSTVKITGMDVDGAVFTISAAATSAANITYTTTATVTISVSPGGVLIEVTGVTTEVV